ncbi:hypothetical protein AX17_006048 [Amanita inopinata Kibby_2008]|nr:hypothetical protein AX17_006048 [Amanita inopinata Kibby_2008]
MPFTFTAHHKACILKQEERRKRIADLPDVYRQPLTYADKLILNQPIKALIEAVQTKTSLPGPGGAPDNNNAKLTEFRHSHPGLDPLEPLDILRSYGKSALLAHGETNCLTEIMIGAAEEWARTCKRQGPLAGVPISVKDTINVEGWDSCVGFSAWVGKPAAKDSALTRLLRDAGAIPFVKTNIPITLYSFESASDVFGACKNPHNHAHTPGGSTGGEAALIALGGSRVGIGSDVAGSVRVPAHYSGVYTIRCSTGRFMRAGNASIVPGQEGVLAVYSPMTRTLDDLETFWRAFISMKPWEYEHSCLPIPWRSVQISQKKLKWGVMWDDGIVAPSPACERALREVVDILKKHGHDVVDINPPSPFEGFLIGSQLILADGGATVRRPFNLFEHNDPGMVEAFRAMSLPRFVKRIWAWYHRYIKGDNMYATIIEGWHPKSIVECWQLVAKREAYRARWFEHMSNEELDFVLCVPNPLPAQRHGKIKEGFKSCNYTFLFNILDLTAGVMPITHVDANQDQFSKSTSSSSHKILGGHKPRNAIEASQQKVYDAADMHGLPVGVQVVGRKLEEEKVLEGMKIIESLLKTENKEYQMIPV